MKKDIIQLKNPKSGLYVKIDRNEGKIVSHKKTKGPYKNIPIIKNSKYDKLFKVKLKCRYCITFNTSKDRVINETENREKFSRLCNKINRFVISDNDACEDFELNKYFYCEACCHRMAIVACLSKESCSCVDIKNCVQRYIIEEAYNESQNRI